MIPPNVLVLHHGRAGSKVLSDMLSQHPGLGWWVKERPLEPRHFTREGSVVQDLKFHQVRSAGPTVPRFVAEVRHGGGRIVHLARRNHLRKVVSSLLGHRDGFHFREGRGDFEPIRLEPDAVGIDCRREPLMTFLEEWDRDVEELWELRPELSLEFDGDVVPDPFVGYLKLERFLGLEPFDPVVRFHRSTAVPLRRAIANWEEVARCLKKTRWAWMLEDEDWTRKNESPSAYSSRSSER